MPYFGKDAEKAAEELADITVNGKEIQERRSILQQVIDAQEKKHAYVVTSPAEIRQIIEKINNNSLIVNKYEFFKDADKNLQEFLNFIVTMEFGAQSGKNALLWLQRKYLSENFSTYDPTSDRDEDLPVDLDHVVPRNVFDFYWSKKNLPDPANDPLRQGEEDKLRDARWHIGNMLGNLCWLSATENRSRGAGGNDSGELKEKDDLLENPVGYKSSLAGGEDLVGCFADLIASHGGKGFKNWGRSGIISWQYIVQMRTLHLIQHLIDDSGIRELRPERMVEASE